MILEWQICSHNERRVVEIYDRRGRVNNTSLCLHLTLIENALAALLLHT